MNWLLTRCFPFTWGHPSPSGGGCECGLTPDRPAGDASPSLLLHPLVAALYSPGVGPGARWPWQWVKGPGKQRP